MSERNPIISLMARAMMNPLVRDQAQSAQMLGQRAQEMATAPVEAWKRMVDSGYQPTGQPNDPQRDQMAKDGLEVAGAIPIAGLAAASVRPGVSLGSGGGRIKGYRGTGHPAKEIAGSPPPSEQFWMTGDRSPLSQRVADTYAEPFLYPDDAPAVMAVEARFKNPRVIDAKGAEWDKVPSPYHDNAPQPSNAIAQAAKEAGHDGVVIENVWDALNYSHAGSPSKSVAAIRPGTVFDDYGNQLFSNPATSAMAGVMTTAEIDEYRRRMAEALAR